MRGLRFGIMVIDSSDRFGSVCLVSVLLSAIELPRIQLCEADYVVMLLRVLQYEAGSAAILHNIPLRGVCFVSISLWVLLSQYDSTNSNQEIRSKMIEARRGRVKGEE